MSIQRQRGPGWTAGVSIAPQTKQVEIMGVRGQMATVRDGFGVSHQIRIDVMRSKGRPPAAGEIWYIDKMLGGWAFQAIVGYEQKKDSSREQVAYTTDVLLAGATEQGHITMSQDFKVLSITTSAAARTRLYATTAGGAADVGRPSATPPPRGSDLILDFTTDSTLLSSPLLPIPQGANLEYPSTDQIPISVTSVAGGPVTVTLLWAPT